MLKRLLSEPLLHFTVLALAIFAAHALIDPRGVQQGDSKINVPAAKIEQLATIFERTWQRPPSPEELKGQIDDYVTEEIYVREALALGLDQNDTVIRRRLRQKIEFLADTAVEALTPSDAELQAYLEAHPDSFALPPRVAFQQVFFSPDKRGDAIVAEATSVLDAVRTNPAADPVALGDASLLPADLPLVDLAEIGRSFGPEFADAVSQADPEIWAGPVASAYGVHLFRVKDREAGRLPGLSEIRDAVQREWTNARQRELEATRIAALLDRYQVTIDVAPDAGAAP